MKRIALFVVAAGLLTGVAAAQAPTAQSLVEQAIVKARAEHKNVLVDFGASWCPWCRRIDALLRDPRFAEKFEASYVIVPITVVERKELAAKTNPGWDALMLSYRKHSDQDIPYEVVLSPNGKPLTDSFEHYGTPLPGNAGFPQTDEEIDAFLAQLRQTARAFRAQDLEQLRAYFVTVREARRH